VCLSDPACRAPALADHILVAESEEAALAQLEGGGGAPLDALVVFGDGRPPPAAAGGAAAPGSGAAAGGAARAAAGGAAARPGAGPAAAAPAAAAAALGEGSLLGGLLAYTIRMNRTDVPPPGLLRDLFDVAPGEMPLPGNLLWWGARA
jgi:hypothetical protein